MLVLILPTTGGVGTEIFSFIYLFFDLEVLMLKYNKTYPYLLSLLHPSVQVYYSISYINIILECRKHIKFRQLIQTSTCRFCCHKIVLIHFFKEKLWIKIFKKLSQAFFQWSGRDHTNQFLFFTWPYKEYFILLLVHVLWYEWNINEILLTLLWYQGKTLQF